MHVSAAPRTVRGAGLLVGLQGLAGIAFAIAVLIRALAGASTPGNNLYGQAAYFAVIGGAVLAVGVALTLGKTWARSPAVVAEIILLGIAWYALGPSGRPEIGVPVAALAVLVLVLLFRAPSRQWALGEEDESA
jgi:hypothetical protein